MSDPTKPYVAQAVLLHGHTTVPVGGILHLTDEQALSLGEAVVPKPEPTAELKVAPTGDA